MSFRVLTATAALAFAACSVPDPVSPDPSAGAGPLAAVKVKSFVVSPETATLQPGDTLRFTATVSYVNGSTESVPVEWSASGGQIDTAGLFTAGEVPGPATIIARCACAPGSAKGNGKAGPKESTKHAPQVDSVTITIAPPVVPVRSVPLRLHRMDGGTGDVLVSNGVPLPAGWLTDPSASPPVRILIDGVEVPAYVGALKGKHVDGSVMSVLVQFVWPSTASDQAVFELGAPARVPARAQVDLLGAMPAAAALPTDPEYLIQTGVVGLTKSRARSPQSPAFFTQYEAEFDRGSDAHWALYGSAWAAMNFYDRAMSHFAFWARTGNPVLWERAARVGREYRMEYLEANAFGSTEWWAQLEGLAVHYWLTGEEDSREAVYRTAESLHRSRGGQDRLTNNTTHPWMDNRVQAKVLGGKVLSYRLEAPAYGAVADWAAGARQDLGWILTTQDPAGPFLFQNICGASSNFMTGLLTSVFVLYYEHLDRDPRIPDAIRRFQDWLWDTQWRPADQVYNYYSLQCETGGPTPGWDLNGLFLEAYGWLYAQTGDAKYLERGDATFAGLVAKTWFQNTKMYNQAFQSSWRYFGYHP